MNEQSDMLDGVRMDKAALDRTVDEVVASVNAMSAEEIEELSEELGRTWTEAGTGS